MIRAILIYRGLCNPQLVEKCTSITYTQRNVFCEIWVKCSNVSDMFFDIELAINNGYLLEEITFLTGLKLKSYAINKEVVEANRTSNQSIEGLIEFEFYKPINEWIEKLEIKKINIDITNRKAVAHITKPINIEQLFDLGIRLLKPKRIPP
jgi:hypothetical protein